MSKASDDQKENVKSYLHEFIDKNFDKMTKIVKREETHMNKVHERGADIPENDFIAWIDLPEVSVE